MNKIILYFLLCFVSINICFGVNKTVMVDKNSNELKVPSKQLFWEKNISVFRQNKRIYVDMTPSISLYLYSYHPDNVESKLKHNFWTDTEIKVINKNGDLLYFTTTINLGSDWVNSLHGSDVLYDKNPKISYWYATDYNNKGGCWGQKLEFYPEANNSIGSNLPSGNEWHTVTAIWIIPSYNSTISSNFTDTTAYEYYSTKYGSKAIKTRGDLIKMIFDDPDNTVLCWRQNLMNGETNSYGYVYNNTDTLAYSKLWRPCVLEPYGPILQQAPININIYGK